jgi:hypothetical protein
MKPVSDLLNKPFGRLTVMSRAPKPEWRKGTDAYWLCQCVCGNTTVVRSYALTTGHTQSCGCLIGDTTVLLPQNQPKYPAHEAAARDRWHSRYLELSFEDYYRLARLNCFYCNDIPKLVIIARRKNDAVEFISNTLDRIDSNKKHTIDNVVPACYICNCAKLHRSIEDFYLHIDLLITNLDRLPPNKYRKQIMLNKITLLSDLYSYKQSAVRALYASYHDGQLELQQFYELCMSNHLIREMFHLKTLLNMHGKIV